MSAYHMDEAMIDLPAGWEDRSMNVFLLPLPDGTAENVVVTREAFEGGDLDTYVQAAIKALSQQFPRFQMLGHRPRALASLAGYEVKMRWVREGVPVYQQQLYLVYYDRLLTITATTPAKQAQACEKRFDELLAAMKFRKR
jgi:hypothetical protein